MQACYYYAIILIISSCHAQISNIFPAVITSGANGSCPTAEMQKAIHDGILADVKSRLLESTSTPCPCGGPGLWRRIAHLNMSDPNQQCPSNWNMISTPVRACGRLQTVTNVGTCDSAVFPSNGLSYSRVCGRINAFQETSTEAFFSTIDGRNPGLEGNYIDGVSLTHGAAGSRQHIWSFASTVYEFNDPGFFRTDSVCPCTNTNFNWPHTLPSFIGNSYFCDTGNNGNGIFRPNTLYPNDPLWDGEGCGPTSTCCQFNNPPWFCTTLPQLTTDDIELRICCDEGTDNEDVLIHLVEIYVV